MYYKIVNYIEVVLNDYVGWFITVGNINSVDKKSIIEYLKENNRLVLDNLLRTNYDYIEFRNIVKILDGDKNIVCYDYYIDDDGGTNISQISIVNHKSQMLGRIKAWCDKNNYDSYYSYNGSLFVLDKYGISNVTICVRSSNSICIYGSIINNIDKEKFINDLKKYLNLNNIILDENKFIGGKINDFDFNRGNNISIYEACKLMNANNESLVYESYIIKECVMASDIVGFNNKVADGRRYIVIDKIKGKHVARMKISAPGKFIKTIFY